MRAAAIAGAAAVTILASACGDDDRSPTADETRVCNAIQAVVDHLAAGRSQQAIDTVALEFRAAVGETKNERMSVAGARFFDELATDIDYRELTIEETAELGQRYWSSLSDILDEAVDECGAVGAPIRDLPTRGEG